MLQDVVAKMPPEDAQYHIKRCVDSGLWVPGGNEDEATEEAKGEEPKASSSAE